MQEQLLIPIKMINQYLYCPRGAYLEFVAGEWKSNRFIAEGESIHKRSDEAKERPLQEGREVRGLKLASARLGITGKMDVVEMVDGEVIPVEYKRGRARDPVPDDHLVQIGAYMMLLEDNGYTVRRGFLYYAGSKKRIEVELTDEVRSLVLETIEKARELFTLKEPPPPLVHDRRCFGCSLAPLCLPDEINFLNDRDEKVRRLAPLRPDTMPLYVQEQGARVSLRNGRIVVKDKDGTERYNIRTMDISNVALFGNVQITSQALQHLTSHEIPVVFFSYGGWLRAIATSTFGTNVLLKLAQYRAYHDDDARLRAARAMVSMKLHNARQLLMRNRCPREESVSRLKLYEKDALSAQSLEQLLGIEGNGTREYFAGFAEILKEHGSEFHFDARNRRPPKDPVNAVLSFGYALLLKDVLVAVRTVGLEESIGLYHEARPGRPALALDLMEEFRAIIVDSMALYLFDSGQLDDDDFVVAGESCNLNEKGRKKVIIAYEHRVDRTIRHPVFGYSLSYRRAFELQARLLARYLVGEMDEYVPFRIR